MEEQPQAHKNENTNACPNCVTTPLFSSEFMDNISSITASDIDDVINNMMKPQQMNSSTDGRTMDHKNDQQSAQSTSFANDIYCPTNEERTSTNSNCNTNNTGTFSAKKTASSSSTASSSTASSSTATSSKGSTSKKTVSPSEAALIAAASLVGQQSSLLTGSNDKQKKKSTNSAVDDGATAAADTNNMQTLTAAGSSKSSSPTPSPIPSPTMEKTNPSESNNKRKKSQSNTGMTDVCINPSSSNKNNNNNNNNNTSSPHKKRKKKKLNYIPSKLGRKGDPRMHRALKARIDNPNISLMDALLAGGFEFHVRDGVSYDMDNVQLGQRKNQLSRRIRLYREQQEKLTNGYGASVDHNHNNHNSSDVGGGKNQYNPSNNNYPKQQQQQQQQQHHLKDQKPAPPQTFSSTIHHGLDSTLVQQVLLNQYPPLPGGFLLNTPGYVNLRHDTPLQQLQTQPQSSTVDIPLWNNSTLNNNNYSSYNDESNSNMCNAIHNNNNHNNLQSTGTNVGTGGATANTTNTNPTTIPSLTTPSPTPPNSTKFNAALNMFCVESSNLMKRCMLSAGFTPTETEECDEKYLAFAQLALELERNRIKRILNRMNQKSTTLKMNDIGNGLGGEWGGGGGSTLTTIPSSSSSTQLPSSVAASSAAASSAAGGSAAASSATTTSAFHSLGSVNPTSPHGTNTKNSNNSNSNHNDPSRSSKNGHASTSSHDHSHHTHDHSQDHDHSNTHVHSNTRDHNQSHTHSHNHDHDHGHNSKCNNHVVLNGQHSHRHEGKLIQHVHRLEGKCGHRAILHKPANGNTHIDFLVDGKIECYANCKALMDSESAFWLSKKANNDDDDAVSDDAAKSSGSLTRMAKGSDNVDYTEGQQHGFKLDHVGEPKIIDLEEINFHTDEWQNILEHNDEQIVDEELLGTLFKLGDA